MIKREFVLITLIINFIFPVISICCASCKKNESYIEKQVPPEYKTKAYIIQLSTESKPVLPSDFNELSRFHFFGICWNGNTDDNLKFSKQMGYSYIMYKPDMEKSSLAKDLFFYVESPEYHVYYTLGIDRSLSLTKAYTDIQKDVYQKFFALKISGAGFPDNMATGWRRNESFSVEPDWQQQSVIDHFISSLSTYIKGKERTDKNFLFAGLAWDVPQFTGDFWGDGKQVSLAFWNGRDSSALFPGRTHEYATYSKGKAAYYMTIKNFFNETYQGRRLLYIYEPYSYYNSWFKDMEALEYNDQVKIMSDAMITQEAGVRAWSTGTDFVDDARAYRTGIFTKNHAGSSTPDNKDIEGNKLIAGKAAINGAWFNWYGRFSGEGDTMRNIYQVPNWLQLIRVAGNWDNLNGVPVSGRKWDGSTYTSPNTRIGADIIYSRQPKTQKLFVVFLNNSGEITLNPGEKIVSVKRVDALFIETVDGKGDLEVEGDKIRLKN